MKHFLRALKDEDCWACNLSGAKTELEELGSIVMGLSQSLSEREQLVLTIAKRVA